MTVGNDFRYALRQLVKRPGFSLTVIATLALGIGANAAIFSAVSSVILAPLPFPESGRLVRIVGTTDVRGEQFQSGVFPQYFHELRERSQTLEAVTAQRFRNLTLAGGGDPERVVGIGITDGWARTVGVQPVLGRHFDAAEHAAGSEAGVAIITHALWQRRFNGAADVLGRALLLNGREYAVVGVMPPQFNFPYNTDLWLPLTVERAPGLPGDLNVAARVKPGVSVDQAVAELEAVGRRIAREADTDARRGLTARSFAAEFPRDPDNAIAALFGAVGFVLLLACVNVANLQLARAAGRTREVAVRATLGATQARQVRQLLAESLVLAVPAGLLGVGLAVLARDWLAMLVPPRLGEVVQNVQLDANVLFFAAGISLLTAVLFGLAPAWRLSRVAPADALRSGGRHASIGGRLLRPLVVAQVGLAFLLLTGAGLMAENFARLTGAGPGYDPAGLYRVGLGLPEPVYDDPDRRASALAALLERVGALPGVSAAGATSLHPVPRTNANTGARLLFPGASPDGDIPVVNGRMVTPEYFRTTGIPLLRGRAFDDGDRADGQPVAVVSRAMAERFWPGKDAIGRRFRPGAGEEPLHTVVGIVGDIVEPNFAPEGTLYRPYAQATRYQTPGLWSTSSVTLLVRTPAEAPGSLLEEIASAVWAVDRSITVFDAAPMEAVLAEPLEGQKIGTLMFLGFGAFGLLLAALGTYGVIALSVTQRRREFGIRLALGITPRGLKVLVVGQGLALVGTGLVLGLAIGLTLSPVAARFLPEVSPRDPAIVGAAVTVLLVAGLAACWMPARRGAHTNPMETLRDE